MKNILIITPFYPYPQNDGLIQDTKAVYYLCQNRKPNERIIIFYYYQHTRKAALKNFLRLAVKGSNIKDLIHYDNNGNTVLLFEHPCIIPHRSKTIPFFDNKCISQLKKYLNKNEIKLDHVVVHFPSRFIATAKMIEAQTKTAVLHSFDVESEKRLGYIQKNIRIFDSIGYRSSNIKDIFENNFKIKSKTFLCLSGIPDVLIPSILPDRIWKKNNTLRLIFAGKLNQNKNVISVLRALSTLSIPYHFEIIGDGEEKNSLERYVIENNMTDCVEFTGNIPRSEVFSKMEQSDVFIMTSFKETLGISYLEAMAIGNIIVGSKGRGVDGIVHHGVNGFLVDPSRVDQIRMILMEINSLSKDNVDKIRRASYETVKDMGDLKMSRKYLDAVTIIDNDCNN